MSTPAATILLSGHGTVLCRDADGALCLRPFAEAGASAVDAASLETGREASGLLVTVEAQGRFLRTEAGGLVLRHDARGVARRELFLPLAAADRAVLAALLEGRWMRRVAAATRRVRTPPAPEPAVLRAPFELAIGDFVVSLAAQLPFTGSALPCRVSLFAGGWAQAEFCRYRPLVALGAFRAATPPETLAAAIRALLEAGGYDGDILVLTDLAAPEVERAMAPVPAARQTVVRLAPKGAAALQAARTAISFIERCRQHQPILCLDAAAPVVAPVEALLRRMTVADGMCVCDTPDGALAIANLALDEDRLRVWRRLAEASDDAGEAASFPGMLRVGRIFPEPHEAFCDG